MSRLGLNYPCEETFRSLLEYVEPPKWHFSALLLHYFHHLLLAKILPQLTRIAVGYFGYAFTQEQHYHNP